MQEVNNSGNDALIFFCKPKDTLKIKSIKKKKKNCKGKDCKGKDIMAFTLNVLAAFKFIS